MTGAAGGLDDKARELALAFDHSFARPRTERPPPLQTFIAIRAGGDPYAIRLSELSQLRTHLTITALPGSDAELLGIASFRGEVAPVYDLCGLLGYPQDTSVPDWFAMAAWSPFALAFDAFEGHLRLPETALTGEAQGAQSRRHIGDVLQTPMGIRPVIDMISIRDAIGRSVHSTTEQQGSD